MKIPKGAGHANDTPPEYGLQHHYQHQQHYHYQHQHHHYLAMDQQDHHQQHHDQDPADEGTAPGQGGPPANGGGPGSGPASGQQQGGANPASRGYTMPGILHFIQHEWNRMEADRAQWDVDRVELEARIAFLQGERKGLENLKNDLVRRIKMLEYALKQERSKFHKLKYGVELQTGGGGGGEDERAAEERDERDRDREDYLPAGVPYQQGRQLIRQYFDEIGYAESILNMRSNKVHHLLGMNNNANQDNGKMNFQRAPMPLRKNTPINLDMEASVLANFEFLSGQEMDVDEIEDMETKQSSDLIANPDEVDAEAEEVLNELNLSLSKEEEAVRGDKGMMWKDVGGGQDGEEDSLVLGELAQLSVTNEPDAYNLVQTKISFRKIWNAKYTLRSHFDAVRALAFHPLELVLITASEDHTLKLWNLQKTVPAKKSASLDVEPLYTFRGHVGPVLCLAMGATGQDCWSGGVDGTIRTWNVPPPILRADPYDAYEPSVMGPILSGHTDAVWSMAYCRRKLLSASADGTIRLWNPGSEFPHESVLKSEPDGAPTCVDFADDGRKAVVSFESAHTVVFDLETGKPVIRLEGEGRGASCVVSHPSSPITITAHEDRHIRFWDNDTGQLAHSMVAHLDEVTSLAVDPHGLFLLSGSHDCSIRLWNLDNKTCVQEITAHRRKFDESILDVAFHPTRPCIASAGADALAKVFV